jgi:hypothetical protein
MVSIMEHKIYPSTSEMLQPEMLSAILGYPVTSTRLVPFETLGWSSTDSQFQAVEIDESEYPPLVIKRMVREKDWVMQVTDDRHWRSIAIWKQGLLSRLPQLIDHAIIACAFDSPGYALLMRNVTHALLDEKPLSEADNRLILDGMSALHAAFWNDPVLRNPSFHLCSPGNLFTHTSPNKIRTIVIENSVPIRQIVLEGWRLLSTFVAPDILDLLLDLAVNPSPLTSALSDYPQTLVHGDWRPANIGIEREGRQRLVLLDWSRPAQLVPAVDLAYYLVTSWSVLPVSKEACIDLYRQYLASRLGDWLDESWWRPQLELSLLGAFLMIGCFNTWVASQRNDEGYLDRARANFTWWSEQVRVGARWLKR